MANETSTADLAAKRLEENKRFVKRTYQTLAISLGVVFFSGCVFVSVYHAAFAGPYRVGLWIAVGLSCLIGTLLCVYFGSDEIVAFEVELPMLSHAWRSKLLGWLAAWLLVTVAVLCASTGGALGSPFNHYLTAISGLAIVFARTKLTRFFMIVVSILAFIASGLFYLPACGGPLDLICSPQPLSSELLWANVLCVSVVAGMAFLASFKQGIAPQTTTEAEAGNPT